ncbi:hypothetical protein D210916BOD24_19200 [Alteromonas sp. D210916BOD_24]
MREQIAYIPVALESNIALTKIKGAQLLKAINTSLKKYFLLSSEDMFLPSFTRSTLCFCDF